MHVRNQACVRIDSFIMSGVRIEFVPTDNVPGYTHKVLIWRFIADRTETIAKDWFAPVESKTPTIRAARYYYEKHVKTTDTR